MIRLMGGGGLGQTDLFQVRMSPLLDLGLSTCLFWASALSVYTMRAKKTSLRWLV